MKEQSYWESVGKSACPDDIARDLSIKAIIKRIPDGARLLDLGCGNGYCTFKFLDSPASSILGIDYSSTSVDAALKILEVISKKHKKNIHFRQGTALNLSDYYNEFDAVVSIRCLINVGDINQQLKSLIEIYKSLKKNGIYLMCENAISGLNLTNSLRKKIGLPLIKTRWHNTYLDEDKFIPEVNKYFNIIEIDHFCSTYFFISRVINAWLANQKGEEPDYNDPLNHMASKLPSSGEFSPMRLYVLEKKS